MHSLQPLPEPAMQPALRQGARPAPSAAQPGPVSFDTCQLQRTAPGLIRRGTCGHHQRGLHHLQLERRRLLLALQRPKHGLAAAELVAAELAHEPRALRGPGTPARTLTRSPDPI